MSSTQLVTTNGRAVVRIPYDGAWLAKNYRRAVENLHGGERGAWMTEAECRDIAAECRAGIERGYAIAFVLASAMYLPSSNPRDDTRRDTVLFLIEELGVSRTEAYQACAKVDLVAALDVGRFGTPTIHHLNAVIWSPLKRRYTLNTDGIDADGWPTINAWMLSAGHTFETATPKQLDGHCERAHQQILADARERAQHRTDDDPYAPPEAEVVEQSTVESRQHADELRQVDELLDAANGVWHRDRLALTAEERQARARDIERLVEVAARLGALVTPVGHADELPL